MVECPCQSILQIRVPFLGLNFGSCMYVLLEIVSKYKQTGVPFSSVCGVGAR